MNELEAALNDVRKLRARFPNYSSLIRKDAKSVKAKIIEVICVESIEGRGTDDDPVRRVTRLFDFDGELIAERDPYAKSMKVESGGPE